MITTLCLWLLCLAEKAGGFCGNSHVEGEEECDEGPKGSSPGASCCTDKCKLIPDAKCRLVTHWNILTPSIYVVSWRGTVHNNGLRKSTRLQAFIHRLTCIHHRFHDTSSTDTSSTDISSTDISSTTVDQRTGQLYIQLLFQQIIIFINSNFYVHYDSFLSIPLTLW